MKKTRQKVTGRLFVRKSWALYSAASAAAYMVLATANQPRAHATDITWTNDGNGEWFDASNWNPSNVPTSTNDVHIEDPTGSLSTPMVTLDALPTGDVCNSLSMYSSSIFANGSASLDVMGNFNGANCGISGTAAPGNGILFVVALEGETDNLGVDPIVIGGVATNFYGQSTFSGVSSLTATGVQNLYDGGMGPQYTNAATGILNVLGTSEGAGATYDYGSIVQPATNDGTNSFGSINTYAGYPDSGVALQGGELIVGGGIEGSPGAFETTGGTLLEIGNAEFLSTGAITGGGNVDFDGGPTTFDSGSEYSTTGTTTVGPGGELNLNTATVPDLYYQTVEVDGALTIGATMSIGAITGTGSTVVTSGGTLTSSSITQSGEDDYYGEAFYVQGSGSATIGSITGPGTSTVQVDSGGNLSVGSLASYLLANSGTTTITGTATVTTVSGTGSLTIGSSAQLTAGGNFSQGLVSNAGTLTVGGDANIASWVTNTGTMSVTGSTTAGSITGTGTLNLGTSTSTPYLTQDTVNNNGSAIVYGGVPYGTNVYVGTVSTFSGTGTLTLAGTPQFTASDFSQSQLNLNDESQMTLTTGTSTIGTVNGTGSLTITSTGTLGVVNLTAGAVTNNGILVVGKSGTSGLGTIGSITGTGSLTIQNGALLQIAHTPDFGTNTVNTVSSLTLSGGGTLDITDNSLVIEYNGGSYNSAIETTVRSEIIGGGIMSSTVAYDHANPSDEYEGLSAIGYSDNYELSRTDIPSQSVLVRFTLAGDADLNGVVNLADFDDWLDGRAGHLPATWHNGDFDYDGSITLGDYDLWLDSYSADFGSLSTLYHAIEVSTLSSSDKTVLLDMTASVPEPVSIGTLMMATTLLLAPRRRRSRR
jgi:hypothetical protein